MARKPLGRNEYVLRGKRHQMTLIGETAPTVSTPTWWRCDVCGRELHKSMNAIIHHSPCVCRTEMTLKAHDYETLATQLGITWSGQYPVNNKIKIEWFGRGGISFYASYSELAYGFIPSRLKGYIE
jgi:hypothetical protein